MPIITELAYEAVVADNTRLSEALAKSNDQNKVLAKLQRAETARKRADKKAAKVLKAKRVKANAKKAKQRSDLKIKLGNQGYKDRVRETRRAETARAKVKKEKLKVKTEPIDPEDEAERLLVSMGLGN